MNKFYKSHSIKIKSTGRDITLRIFHPIKSKRAKEKTPGVLWIHGGGYTSGMADMIYISRAIRLVKRYGAVAVTPEYRLSGESPYPAALEDCYAALKYLKEHADELGINSSQIMVGGESAGGGLAAALCMYARDKGEVSIAYQMPLYPMIDNLDTESSRDNNAPIWNTKKNHQAWKAYLGELWELGENVPPYAAAARQTDYSKLPPAYTFVGDIEPFYCETLAYINNLKEAGVKASVDVYPDCFHAFDILFPLRKVSKQAADEFDKQFLFACKHYFAKQPK